MLLGMTFLLAVVAVAANKKFTLVIDAGHGGHDTGALGAFSKEKNINLNVALAFGRYVESKLVGRESHLYPQDGCVHPLAYPCRHRQQEQGGPVYLRTYQCGA